MLFPVSIRTLLTPATLSQLYQQLVELTQLWVRQVMYRIPQLHNKVDTVYTYCTVFGGYAADYVIDHLM